MSIRDEICKNSTSPPCECKAPGFCKRHGVQKNQNLFELCKSDICARYIWDQRAKKNPNSLFFITSSMHVGPGTVIKNLLASYGIQTKEKGCKCNHLATLMDKDGPDKVEAKIDYYVEQMRESIKEWKGQLPIPTPPDFVIRKLILHGVKLARGDSGV